MPLLIKIFAVSIRSNLTAWCNPLFPFRSVAFMSNPQQYDSHYMIKMQLKMKVSESIVFNQFACLNQLYFFFF